MRRAALSGAHKLAVHRIPSLSHHTNGASDGANTKTTMILESLGANIEMSATGEDPVSRPYRRSKMGP